MIDVLKYLGRKWAEDFNCWDFVSLIYRNEYGIELCPHAINGPGNIREACKAVETERAKAVWHEIALGEESDIVLLGRGRGLKYHAGFLVIPGKVLHLMDNAGAIVQDTPALKNQFQTIQFFRHADLRPCN